MPHCVRRIRRPHVHVDAHHPIDCPRPLLVDRSPADGPDAQVDGDGPTVAQCPPPDRSLHTDRRVHVATRRLRRGAADIAHILHRGMAGRHGSQDLLGPHIYLPVLPSLGLHQLPLLRHLVAAPPAQPAGRAARRAPHAEDDQDPGRDRRRLHALLDAVERVHARDGAERDQRVRLSLQAHRRAPEAARQQLLVRQPAALLLAQRQLPQRARRHRASLQAASVHIQAAAPQVQQATAAAAGGLPASDGTTQDHPEPHTHDRQHDTHDDRDSGHESMTGRACRPQHANTVRYNYFL